MACSSKNETTYFHSTTLMHNFRIGLVNVKQNNALEGLSGCGLPIRRVGFLITVGERISVEVPVGAHAATTLLILNAIS